MGALTGHDEEVDECLDQVVRYHAVAARLCLDDAEALVIQQLIKLVLGGDDVALAQHNCRFVHLNDGARAQLLCVDELVG